MFEENATAMMLILMSSTGWGTIHFVRSEDDGRRGNWNLGDNGLNCKVWAKEMDKIVSANVFVLNSKKQHSNIVSHCTI